MKNIIKKILREDREQMFLDKIVQVMKNDFPLFKNMKLYGFYEQLSEEELIYVLSTIFGEPVRIIGLGIYSKRGKEIYYENYGGKWWKKEYDERGRLIYKEFSYGKWYKYEYDKNGNQIYSENSDGKWWKKEYDKNGNLTYTEHSDEQIINNK